MNNKNFPEIKPGRKFIKWIYVKIVMIVFGRAFQAGYGVDKGIKAEFDAMPDDFMVDLYVWPNGPHMIVGKNDKGKMRYLGGKPEGKKITLKMEIKSIEAAILMFTFQESTYVATCRERLVVDGDIPYAAGIVRVMNLIEIFLLPKFAAKLGIKRYPSWSELNPLRKWISRILIYTRLITDTVLLKIMK